MSDDQFFDNHVCTATCVLHDVLFPQRFITQYEHLPLTTVYDGAPDESVPMTMVTMVGGRHPNESAGAEDCNVTVAFVSEFVLDFVASIATEVELKQPGFLAALVAMVNHDVLQRVTENIDIHQQRIKQLVRRWADDAGIDTDTVNQQMGWSDDD